ncbi:MAG: anion permease [Candidatus Thorarchaeota archaeon]|nr:anion permease [Candidatus Thorarchaeota archaeon]
MELEPLLLGALLVISFLVAFAIGSNDEAMAPAVGANVFTVRTAVLIGGFITIVGAVSLGSNVSEKVGSDLVGGKTVSTEMVFSVLISIAIWLIIASSTKGLPISTTQCIVGSIIGVAGFAPFVGYDGWGMEAIDWFVVLEVFAGWIISPIIGFLIAAAVFAVVRRLQKRAQGFTALERQEQIAAYGLAVFLIITSLSRGGNDVANAIAPVIVLPEFLGTTQLGPFVFSATLIPLLVGGCGMALGLIVIGRKVIKTLATEVVSLSPSSALSATISVAVILLLGTLIGLPLSGTHLLVAALIAVGWVADTPVQMQQVKEILISWIVTVPVSAILGVAVLWMIAPIF